MARKVCQTVAGDSTCCQAAAQGRLNQPIPIRGGRGCGVCSVHPSTSKDPRKAGHPVFQFRFTKNANCGIGPRGCAALATMAAPAGGGLLGGPLGQAVQRLF